MRNLPSPSDIELHLLQAPRAQGLLHILQPPQGIDGRRTARPGATTHCVEGHDLFIPPLLGNTNASGSKKAPKYIKIPAACVYIYIYILCIYIYSYSLCTYTYCIQTCVNHCFYAWKETAMLSTQPVFNGNLQYGATVGTPEQWVSFWTWNTQKETALDLNLHV